jgi:hypothetical protein
VRFESHELPGGFLPLNFFSIGAGVARYVSRDVRIDGTPVRIERATTFAVRVDLGLNVRLRKQLGLRVGAFSAEGDLSGWFQRLEGVLPAGEDLQGNRIGGYAMLYFRP